MAESSPRGLKILWGKKEKLLVTSNFSFSHTVFKRLADDNFKFDENGGKFSERVENIVRKGEIARYEQFLLFPQRFQETCTSDYVKTRACLGKG